MNYRTNILGALTALALVSCGSGNKSESHDSGLDILDQNISGTWRYSSETEVFSIETGEYLHTQYKQSVYFINDTEDGVVYSRCETWGILDSFTVKTSEGVSIGTEDKVFSLISKNKLFHFSASVSEDFSDVRSESAETLIRIDLNINQDFGDLALQSESLNFNELNDVCVDISFRPIEQYPKYLKITIPFSDDNLALALTYTGSLEPGVYQYQKNSLENKFIYIGILSSAIEFINLYPDHHYEPESATIEITSSIDGFVTARVEMVGPADESLSGEFSIDLDQP